MSTGKKTTPPPKPPLPQIPVLQRHYPSAAYDQRGSEKLAAIVDTPKEFASVTGTEYQNIGPAGRYYDQQRQGKLSK